MQLQIFDADYTMLDDKPLLRFFCKDIEGRSVCVFYNKFMPYLYAMAQDYEAVKSILKSKFSAEVVKIEEVERFLPLGYAESKTKLLKITTRTPGRVPEIKEALLGIAKIFEADILFKYRAMVDMGFGGLGWIDVKGSPIRTNTVLVDSIQAEEIKPIEKEENAPLKIMGFDIETEAPIDRALDPTKDPVTMISFAFSTPYKNAKTLVVVSRRVNTKDTICVGSEKEVLEKFKEVIADYNPDIITGYNINGFDLPAIVSRMEALRVRRNFGLVGDKQVIMRDIGLKNRFSVTGRVVLDSYEIVKKNFSFKRYTLDTVCKELLGEQKVQLSYKELAKLWKEGRETDRIVDYSRQDAVLALNLVEKMQLMDKYIAIAHLSGITLQDVLDGGETVRIENMLLREFNRHGYVLPLKPDAAEGRKRVEDRETSGLKGGLVLEPEKGLHADGCVVVLDFKSLYPSIIRTYNICPTTLTKSEEDCYVSPFGAKFVKHDKRYGILPKILDGLITERFAVKKQMKTESGEKKRLLDAKQYALKILANSFYGYVGYLRARTYMVEVANAITSYGRFLIEATRKKIEERGYKVIYGDTDSVMFKVPTTDVDQAWEMGKQTMDSINSALTGKLEMDLEKVFRTLLIVTKKRYAGWSFSKGGKGWENKIEMKGIETVRRDWCDLVSETQEAVLNIILKEGSVQKAVELVQKEIEKLNRGETELQKLAITKGITKNIDAYEGKLPHIELARKMRERNPTEAPVPGDRLSFVIVSGNQLLSKRAEDIAYIKEKNLRIDANYYIDNQLLPPVERILGVMDVDRNQLLGKGKQMRLNFLNAKVQSVVKDPERTTIQNADGFVCRKCDTNFRRVPLMGKCTCGGEIFASGGGSIGKFVSV